MQHDASFDAYRSMILQYGGSLERLSGQDRAHLMVYLSFCLMPDLEEQVFYDLKDHFFEWTEPKILLNSPISHFLVLLGKVPAAQALKMYLKLSEIQLCQSV